MSNSAIVAFNTTGKAAKALDYLRALHEQQRVRLGDAIVVVRGPNGEVSINDENRFVVDTGDSAAAGETAPITGTVLEGQQRGSLLDAQFGAVTGMTPDFAISEQQAEELARRLPDGTSALLFEFSDMGTDFVAAVIRDLGGEPVEVNTGGDDSGLASQMRPED